MDLPTWLRFGRRPPRPTPSWAQQRLVAERLAAYRPGRARRAFALEGDRLLPPPASMFPPQAQGQPGDR